MTPESLPAAVRADALSAHYKELMRMSRSRTDATAKALGALGGAVVGAIGIAKFADVFPFEGPWLALATLVIGLLSMVGGLVWLIRVIQELAEPIMASTDPRKMRARGNLGGPECDLIEEIYATSAKLNRVGSLQTYNARAHRLEGIADRVGGDTGDTLRLRADVIRAEVLAVQDRALALALGKKVTRTLSGRQMMIPVCLMIVGLVAASASADKIEAARHDAEQQARSAYVASP